MRQKVAPKIRFMVFKILFESLVDNPSENTIINEVSLIINPARPAELNKSALNEEETKRTIIPEGTPKIMVAKKTGISEKSNFKKGNTGKIESLPKYPSTSVSTINTELYVILSVLFLFIFFISLTYTKY